MKIDQKKFDTLLIRHKKLLMGITKHLEEEEMQESFWLFKRLSQQSRELALVSSGFKCERCGSEENLTIHHLIMKKAREYMPHDRWFTQRIYWANRICLCIKCHKLYHNFVDKIDSSEGDLKKISEKYLNKLKKKGGYPIPNGK